MLNNLNEKIRASLVVASYLDTLGFKNGQWEFNFNLSPDTLEKALSIQNEIVHHFFSLGGYNINISSWNASDDTIMMIATMKACKNKNNFMEKYVEILSQLKEDKRASGYTTIKSLSILEKNKDINQIKYEELKGGNGAAMRTSPIGLVYYKEEDLNSLIKNSLEASIITHNYPLGYLGGIVTALFTSYAVRNIPPEEWSKKLIKLYESNIIDDYLKSSPNYKDYLKDKNEFWDLWYKYNEHRLPNFSIKSDNFLFNSNRVKELLNYTPGVQLRKNKGKFDKFASTGVGAVIVSYDSLLMSIYYEDKKLKCNWESLVFFSTLHFGDNDSTGIITGAWFGALFGFTYFDKNKINQLEFKDEILKL